MIEEATLVWLSIEQLKPHPQNPRLIQREDVINSIVAQLEDDGQFSEMYALYVRPKDGSYEIVSGHHRFEAAKRVGLDKLPCWAKEMTDDEAYMQLALSNSQGEFSPLEVGLHAFEATKNDRLSLSAYARLIGGHRQTIQDYRSGAEVYVTLNIKLPNIRQFYVKKAAHLTSISRAESELWPLLGEWIITPNKQGKDQSVNQTEELVKAIRKIEIPDKWQAIFLPLVDVVKSYMAIESPNGELITDLVNMAQMIEDVVRTSSERFSEDVFSYTVEGFHEWLRSGIGTYSWDPKSLGAYRSEVVEAARRAMKPPEPDVHPGEWYGLGNHLLYCGDTGASEFWDELPRVKFAFADPPYNAGVADWDEGFQWGHDWLIDKADVVAVTPGIESIQRFYRDATKMPYAWSISVWIDNGMTRGRLGFGNWIYVGVFAETDKGLNRQTQDVIRVSIKAGESKDFKGQKPSEMMAGLIELFTDVGDVIVDPFLGSGTSLFEANKLGRRCIGGEIRPDFCNEIIRRWQDENGRAAERTEGRPREDSI